LGLSFDQVVQLTEQIRAVRFKSGGSESNGEKIVKEVIDMLYVMGKRGEDIEPLAARLSLHPAQRVLLQGAALPPREEAQLIVDYLSKLDVVSLEDTELAEFYLPSLGASATEAAVRCLEKIKQSPSQWGKVGYAVLFRSLRWSGDARALTLAKHFEKDDHWMHYFAGLSRKHMELLGKWSSFSSPNPPTIGPMFQ
jgi:hypothetical protein